MESFALRHQINVLRRCQCGRVRLKPADRFLWAWMLRLWSGWRSVLLIVKPEAVIGWHRQGSRLYWRWKSRGGKPGRPSVDQQVQELIEKVSVANPLWGASRIHGEYASAVAGPSPAPRRSLSVTIIVTILGLNGLLTLLNNHTARHRSEPHECLLKSLFAAHIKTANIVLSRR